MSGGIKGSRIKGSRKKYKSPVQIQAVVIAPP
jgi:hypothetical protein